MSNCSRTIFILNLHNFQIKYNFYKPKFPNSLDQHKKSFMLIHEIRYINQVLLQL